MRAKLGIALVVLVIAGGVLTTTAASGQTVLDLSFGPVSDQKVAFIEASLQFGDRAIVRGPLLDDAQSDSVGTGYMQCLVHKRIVGADRGLWNCNYVLELEDGDIVLQGLDPRGPGEYEVAVLGGTGAYAAARGDASFTDVGNDENSTTEMSIRLSD